MTKLMASTVRKRDEVKHSDEHLKITRNESQQRQMGLNLRNVSQ